MRHKTPRRILRNLSVVLLLLTVARTAVAETPYTWASWRGPKDSGSLADGQYPADLSPESATWRVTLPGKGCSTPIVWKKTIFVTAPVSGKDALLAYDWDGKPLWNTSFGAENAGKHRNGSGCNPSPVTDGDAVFVNFKSGTLAAVEMDGTQRWATNLVERFGKDTLFWDHGSSPVLTEKHVVVARMHKGESWLAAFDKETGKMAWKQQRNFKTPVECDHGYATPLLIQHQDKPCLLLWGAQHVTIHDAANGEVVWTCGNFNPDNQKLWPSIATPVIVGDVAVVAYGRNDRGIPRLHGVRLTGRGDVTDTSHVWERTDIGTFVPSPVAYQDKVYLVRDKGEVECIDPQTGKNIWSARFPKGRGAFYASPLIAGDKLYAPREDGTVFVASVANNEFKLLSENKMGESVIGSPVPVAGRIFLRGVETLYCFESTE